jgi:osmotically-inducible protein OsmY
MILASLSNLMSLTEPAADIDLARRVRQYLHTQQPALLRRIELTAQLGIVTIQGVVCSFYERQLAIACTRRVAGVRQVVDRLAVVDENEPLASRRPVPREFVP